MPPNHSTLTDSELIQQILDGSVNLFERLLQKYQAQVLKIVKKHVPYSQIEEIAHEVFIRAYQSLPTFAQTSDFTHWLSSIAVRTCYDFWRKEYRNREWTMSSLTEKQQQWLENMSAAESRKAFDEEAEQHAASEALEWALSTLSAEDRMVVELVYLEEMSGKDAAKLLGWSVANVKVRAFRVRKKLQKILARKEKLSRNSSVVFALWTSLVCACASHLFSI